MSAPGKYRLGLLAALVAALELLAGVLMITIWWWVRSAPGIRFDKPDMLWYLLGGPVLALLFLLELAWRNRALGRFASPPTLPRMVPGLSSARVLLRFLLLRHGLGLVVLAMAGPQFGTRYEEVKAEGIDVVVALDVSNSMACEDIKPDRMEAARRAMAQLVDRLKGDRLGIVVFAGEAFVQLPITTDRSAAKLFLNSIGIGTVATQGTAIGAAISMAQRSFGEESVGSRVIIVITDGENHEDDAEGAARRAAEAGIIVHTVGMGTPNGGPIPIRQGGRLTGFRKDRNGNTVVTRLNEDMLRAIATAGNGSYVRGDQGTAGIVQLVDDLRNMDRTEIGSYRYAAHEDQYQYPLALGIALVVLSMAFGERGRVTAAAVRVPALWALPLLGLYGCGGEGHQVERSLRAGNAQFDKGHHAGAVEAYRSAGTDPRASYNAGHAHYRMGQWDDAAADFKAAGEALLAAEEKAIPAAHAFHNMGNAHLRKATDADSLEKHYADLLTKIRIDGEDIQRKVELYVLRDSLRRERRRLVPLVDSALAHSAGAYRNALRQAPHDEESRHNLAVVQALVAARAKPDKGGGDGGDKDDQEKVLGERARMILEKADELVEEYRFQEALALLQKGLQEDPTLEQKQEYMQKLETVTEAAAAQ
jgi:Ca-activated chloride channel family protein